MTSTPRAATHPPQSDHPRPAANPGAIVAIGAFCGIVVSLTQTMIIPLIPTLPTILHSSAADASWAITATLLTGAVATPIAGRLGDMFGKRLMLLISLAILVAGSALSALADSLIPMVVGRGMQGMAMGVVALGISIMRDELPPQRVGPAIAKMSATMGVGGAIGIPVAALVAEKGSWHFIFWGAAVLAAVCFVAVLKVIPESPIKTPARFDYLGAVGLAIALTAFLMVVTKGADWGWGSGLVLGLLFGSLLVFAVWGWWELRRPAPLVDLRISARRQVLLTNITSVAVGFAMFGTSLIPIQILMAPRAVEYGLGLTMVQAGLMVAPGGLMMYVASSVGARISAIKGPRVSLATGIVAIWLGYLMLLVARSEPWHIVASGVVTGAGIGIAYAAMPALIMAAVPLSETAAANGLNSLMRSLGTSISSAAIGAILANLTLAHDPRLGPIALPSDHGFVVALLVCLAASALAFVFALVIPRRGPSLT